MTRLALIGAVLLLAASPVRAQAWAKAKLAESPRHLEWVTLRHDDREVACFVGYPEIRDKATAVVVIHDIWGMSDWARGIVDDFAAAGYIAIAPDLLWGAGPRKGGSAELDTDAIPLAMRALSPDQVTADLKAAVAYAAKLPSCNGKVVVVGFCWGGGEAFRFATNTRDLRAAFVFYGDSPAAADLGRIACPVHAFYAENDARIDAAVPETVRLMKAAGKSYDTIFYPGAGHGFMKAGQAPPPPADADQATLDRYKTNHAARENAWRRLLGLLKAI